MNLPCRTCLILPICKQLICPNPPRFVSSSKIIKYLLTNNSEMSINCTILREYCEMYDDNLFPNHWPHIYTVASFFSHAYEEP